VITLSQTTEQMLSVEALPLAAPDPGGDGGGTKFLITTLFIALGGAIGFAIGFERGTKVPLRDRRGSAWT